MTVTEMAAHAARAEQEVLAALDRLAGDDRAVVVDSPPGAGKTTLVVRAAVTIAAAGEPVMVVAQTNEQVDDLVCRIAEAAPSLAVGRLSAADYVTSRRVGRALFVGCPGQLDAVSVVETQRWTGQTWDPVVSAVEVLLRNNPSVQV